MNSFCQSCKYKQESIRKVADIIEIKDTSVDLTDGLYHISVREEDQKLLSFQFEGRYFLWVVLPFGFCIKLQICGVAVANVLDSVCNKLPM